MATLMGIELLRKWLIQEGNRIDCIEIKAHGKCLLMSRTKVFVSSTCYDLAAVRESLREHILKFGHEPLLSEYPSFPVNPDETTVANCKNNVEKHTDILVLIIGGRRGAMDEDSGRSVTNLEYDTAQRRGIPCFVFINRSVNTLLPVWKKNPNADFTPTVDYPEVFKFIERIREENRWTFTFEKTGEIEECLSAQLSSMLRELLERSRTGKLDPLASFSSETEKARRLALEKPEYWEFLLAGELLSSKLSEVRKRFDRQKVGLVHVPSFMINGRDFPDWIGAKMNDLMSIVNALAGQLPVIQTSFGPPGKPGDAHQILASIEEFIRMCNQLVDWEDDLRAGRPPESWRPLKDTMKGWTEGVLKKMEELPKELLAPFANGARPTGQLSIMLTVDAPCFDEFYAEYERLTRNPTIDLIQ